MEFNSDNSLKHRLTGVTSGVGTAYPSGAPEFTPLPGFVDRCLSFCTFSFGNCVVCSSSIYGFRLPHWYFQTIGRNVAPFGHIVLYPSRQ